MRRATSWLVAALGLVLAVGLAAEARADHGYWETETVWIEPVVATQTVWVPGRWEDHTVWVPGRYETQTQIVEELEWQPHLVWVDSGYWEERGRWVAGGHWVELWDDDASQPYVVWVATSHWEGYEVWVDTSRWEDHGRWVAVHREEVVTVWVPGRWTTERRWIDGYHETAEVVTVPGHYETRRRWVTLPHPTPTPAPTSTPRPAASPTAAPSPRPTPPSVGSCTIPAGIHKVTDYYAGTQVEETDDGIDYQTITDNRPNNLYAVDLGSYSKGASSPYDRAAFNGRNRDVNGELLAGTFYQNYRKRDGCYVPTSIVFFQDDRVVFTTGVVPSLTPTAVVDPEPTVTATPTPTVTVTQPPVDGSDGGSSGPTTAGPVTDPTPANQPGPRPPGGPGPDPAPTDRPGPEPQPPSGPGPDPTTPSPRPPQPPGVSPTPSADPLPPVATPRPAYDPPVGALRVAPVVAGSAVAGDAEGFSAIEVLRGAPIDLWVRAAVEPPSTDPAATIALERWTFVRGVNDRPGGTQPGSSGGPDEALRLQWNDVTPVVNGQLRPYNLHLRALLRVTYGDGTARDFALEGSIAVTVRFQGATTWEDTP